MLFRTSALELYPIIILYASPYLALQSLDLAECSAQGIRILNTISRIFTPKSARCTYPVCAILSRGQLVCNQHTFLPFPLLNFRCVELQGPLREPGSMLQAMFPYQGNTTYPASLSDTPPASLRAGLPVFLLRCHRIGSMHSRMHPLFAARIMLPTYAQFET